MDWPSFHTVLLYIQRSVSLLGVLIIVSGVVFALSQFFYFFIKDQLTGPNSRLNEVRLNLGRILLTGLEFIVAADLIGTTTAPDYYSVGILGIIVIIRTVLSFTINRELMMLGKEAV
ncbi:MAG: DUF1622 domain-containing protein [Gammaproteobacteria bacterium]